MKPCFLLAASLLFGCGGTTVVEEPGQGAGGAGGGGSSSTTNAGGSTSTSPSSSTGTNTTTGPSGCSQHQDCPGGACIFTTGACSTACKTSSCESCGPGLVCNACATSSCPSCKDCMAACVPPVPGECDDDDPCADGMACHHPSGTCMSLCKSGMCADPNTICAQCATGSCCGCENCVDLCMFVDG